MKFSRTTKHDQELLNMKLDLESKIDENNGTIVKKDEECKEKLQELAAKDIQHDQEFLNMKSDLESKINENNDTIVKKDEECKEKVQELATKDIQHDQAIEKNKLDFESMNKTNCLGILLFLCTFQVVQSKVSPAGPMHVPTKPLALTRFKNMPHTPQSL